MRRETILYVWHVFDLVTHLMFMGCLAQVIAWVLIGPSLAAFAGVQLTLLIMGFGIAPLFLSAGAYDDERIEIYLIAWETGVSA